jgi:hypothetical protein
METRSNSVSAQGPQKVEKTFLEKLFGPIQGTGIEAPELWDRMRGSVIDPGRLAAVRTADAKHRSHFSTKILLAAGVSTRPYLSESSLFPFLTSVLKDLARWHHALSPLWQKIINYTIIPPLLAVLWQVAMAVPTFVVKVLRPIAWGLSMVASAVIPLVIAYAMREVIESILSATFSIFAKIPLLLVPAVIAIATAPIGFILKFMADVIFYPYETFKENWEASRTLSDSFLDQVIGIARKGVAILTVLAAISLFAGLGVVAAMYMPGFIVAGLSAALAYTGLASLSAAVFAPIGAAITSSALGVLLTALGVSNGALGFAVVAGATFGLAASLGNYVTEKVSDWYHSFALVAFLTKKDVPALAPATKQSTSKTMETLSIQPPDKAPKKQPLLADVPKPKVQTRTQSSLSLYPRLSEEASPLSTTIIHDEIKSTTRRPPSWKCSRM